MDLEKARRKKERLKRLWGRVKNRPKPERKTGRQHLEEQLHGDFRVAVQAAIGLEYDGLLTQQQREFIIFRAGLQPRPKTALKSLPQRWFK